jgi:hypothetical protein
MIGRITVKFRRAAGNKGRIVFEAAPSGRKSWRSREATRQREVLHDYWNSAR